LEEFYCTEHKENILEFFNLDCDKLICKVCCISTHKNSNIILIKDSKEKLIELINKIKTTENLFKENLLSYDEKQREIENNIKNYEEEIRNFEKKIEEFKNKIIDENNNLKINKNNKNEVLFEYQKLINLISISKEKQIQFLIHFDKFGLNKNLIDLKNYYKEVVSFGNNTSGQLGINTPNKILSPKLFNFKNFKIKKISCLAFSSFIISGK
jgi:hypothetical protein